MVMEEMAKPRETFVLVRGDFRQKGDKVMPGVPASLSPLPAGAPANRLGLAQWLVDRDNPLVSRVTVNRYWQQYFGTGIVKTSEDFGSQGEWPSHPELLDWLAAEFMDSGWNVKALQKLIVMSATYRQSSRVEPESLKHDPYNRLLARGARFRLDAEMIRDNALAVSGLLDEPHRRAQRRRPISRPACGKRSASAAGSARKATCKATAAICIAAGLYVYWKRAMPYPPLVTFDAPNREVCTDCRAADEHAAAGAGAVERPGLRRSGPRAGPARCCARAARPRPSGSRLPSGCARPARPRAKRLDVLAKIYETQLAQFQSRSGRGGKAAERSANRRGPRELDPVELAAWTAVGNVLLNLDETITKG